MAHPDELPTWLAYPAARALPSEGQVTVGKARDLLTAYLEYACLMLLSDVGERTESFAPDVEAALRQAATRQMGFDDWRTLYLALAGTPRGTEVLGVEVAAPFPAAHPVVQAYAALTGHQSGGATLGDLLGSVAPSKGPAAHTGPEIRDAALALLQASGPLSAYTLCYVVSVREIEEEAFEVRYRPLVGTRFPEVKVRRFWSAPPLTEGELCFWDVGKKSVPIAPWLAWYDTERLVMRMYHGRDAATRRWIYRSRNVASEPVLHERIASGAPVFLAEPTWHTPGGAMPRRHAPPRALAAGFTDPEPPEVDLENDTQTLRRAEVDAAIKEVLARGGVALSADVHPTLTDARKRILRVIGGRSMLAYRELQAHTTLIIGRSPSHADFVVQHPKVSRRNTMVWVDGDGVAWVKDLGSTNGTRLNGVSVDQQPSRLRPFDVLQVGPTLMRLELVEPDSLGRIDRILAFAQDEERDPLTGLLKPKHLPRKLRLEGDRFGPDDSLTGLVVYIDQLSSIHAQHGKHFADMVFSNVARLVLFQLADPLLCSRIGYGECLIVLRGDSQGGALEVAGNLLAAVTDHAWVPMTLQVTVTIGIAKARPGQTLEDWIGQGREAALRGRARGGPVKIHREAVEG